MFFLLLLSFVLGVDRPIPLVNGRHLYYLQEDSMGTMGFQPGAFIGVFDHTCRQEFLETGFLTQFWMKRPHVMVGWFDKGQRPKEWWVQ